MNNSCPFSRYTSTNINSKYKGHFCHICPPVRLIKYDPNFPIVCSLSNVNVSMYNPEVCFQSYGKSTLYNTRTLHLSWVINLMMAMTAWYIPKFVWGGFRYSFVFGCYQAPLADDTLYNRWWTKGWSKATTFSCRCGPGYP